MTAKHWMGLAVTLLGGVVLAAGAYGANAPAAAAPKGYTGAAADGYGGGIKMDEGDWPQWRGPTRCGVSTETGLLDKWPEGGPPLAWKVTGLGKGLAAVVILKGRFYMIGDLDNVAVMQCFDLKTREKLWSCKVGPAWEAYNEGPSPQIDGDALFGQTGKGDCYCIGLDGKLRWVKNTYRDFGGRLMNPQYGYPQTPLVDGDRVVVNPGGKENCVVALDRKTGATIWKIPASETGGGNTDGAAYSSPVITEGGGLRHYVMLVGNGLLGVNPKDGKVLWTFNNHRGEANVPTPIVRGDYVYCCNSYGGGACLLKLSSDGAGGVKAEKIYYITDNDHQNLMGQSVLVGDHCYTGTGGYSGNPTCTEFLTGKVVWKGKQEGAGVAGVTSADGKLIFRAESGEVSLIEASPKAFNLISVFTPDDGSKKGEPHWSHPVVSHGMLFIRQHDTLLAYDIKKK
jgi:outer membrane protein assembly factor BamB